MAFTGSGLISLVRNYLFDPTPTTPDLLTALPDELLLNILDYFADMPYRDMRAVALAHPRLYAILKDKLFAYRRTPLRAPLRARMGPCITTERYLIEPQEQHIVDPFDVTNTVLKQLLVYNVDTQRHRFVEIPLIDSKTYYIMGGPNPDTVTVYYKNQHMLSVSNVVDPSQHVQTIALPERDDPPHVFVVPSGDHRGIYLCYSRGVPNDLYRWDTDTWVLVSHLDTHLQELIPPVNKDFYDRKYEYHTAIVSETCMAAFTNTSLVLISLEPGIGTLAESVPFAFLERMTLIGNTVYAMNIEHLDIQICRLDVMGAWEIVYTIENALTLMDPRSVRHRIFNLHLTGNKKDRIVGTYGLYFFVYDTQHERMIVENEREYGAYTDTQRPIMLPNSTDLCIIGSTHFSILRE